MSEPIEMPAEVVTIDNHSDRQEQLRELIDGDPRLMEEVKAYFQKLQIDYARRVGEIEVFLGFVEGQQDLGTRLHRLETFLGVKAT